MLVYPEQDAPAVAPRPTVGEQSTLVLLDGTWRKVYRMLCLNP
ncbi:hypothetical protein [Shewanella sp.]